MAKAKRREHIHEDPAGLFIPAGIFLGLGIGGFLENYGAGILTGLGAGFLVMAIIKLNKKK